jgi:hypothetical protein
MPLSTDDLLTLLNDPANVQPIVDSVQILVEDGFATAQSYADTSFTRADGYLDTLQTLANQLADVPSVDVDIGVPTSTITPYVSPTAPVEPTGLTVTMPEAPDTTAPTVPDALAATLPVAPELATVETPEIDAYALPAVPSLTAYTIPSAPTLSLPTFTATLAAAPDAPENTFEFTETAYTSTLKTALQTVLLEWVNGASTGIDATVEAAIWNRGRARVAIATARKRNQAIREFATRGFTKPAGALAIELEAADQEAQNVETAESREIAINQANLEQANRHKAMEMAIGHEGTNITYTGQVAQRAFDAAKYVQEVGLQIFDGLVKKYQADAGAYETEARVFKTRLEGELAELDIYRSELEGQRLIGTLNQQSVEVYEAQLSGVETLVEVFKGRVEAANLSLQGNKLLLEGFATETQAYDSLVRAKASEYQGYESQVRAIGVLADVYGKEVQAEATRAETGIKLLDSRTKVFEAEVKGEASRVDSETEAYKAEVLLLKADADTRIAVATQLIARAQELSRMLIECARGGASVAAQLAASSLSAVNLSAGLHAGGSATTSFNEQNSMSGTVLNTILVDGEGIG